MPERDEMQTNPGLLSRWSQRKLQATHPEAHSEAHSAPELPTELFEIDNLVTDQPPSQSSSQSSSQADSQSSSQSDSQSGLARLADAESHCSTAGQRPEVAEPSTEPALTDEDMPEIESLHSQSDISCFFSSGVSDSLRQAALRHLWRLPAFNFSDGLNDYDEDYTSFEPLGDIVTSDMRYQEQRKLAQQALLDEDPKQEGQPSIDHSSDEQVSAHSGQKESQLTQPPKAKENPGQNPGQSLRPVDQQTLPAQALQSVDEAPVEHDDTPEDYG